MRFLGYFLLVFAALFVLRELPILGGLFRIPLLGFFLAALVTSALVARAGALLAARAKLRSQVRELGTVDTPQMRGKLGRLLLQSGRAARAVAPLREAVEADPANVEWHYRLGSALLATGQAAEALSALERAAELQEGHAYGAVLLQLAQAAQLSDRAELALAALERFERLQGPTAEWAYRRGRTLKALGRAAEAREAFASLAGHVRRAPKYQKAEARGWAARGLWARLF